MKIRRIGAKATRRGDVEGLSQAYKGRMADTAFVATIIVFFVLAALFVRACDRFIGDDEEALPEADTSAGSEQLAA